MMFQTLDEFKAVAEFFPKGRIIPQRIMKERRKVKHLIVFGSGAFALPTPRGYVIYSLAEEEGGAAITIKPTQGLHLGIKILTESASKKRRFYKKQKRFCKHNESFWIVGNQNSDAVKAINSVIETGTCEGLHRL